eukprot:3497729-Rhodomonas_salina.1
MAADSPRSAPDPPPPSARPPFPPPPSIRTVINGKATNASAIGASAHATRARRVLLHVIVSRHRHHPPHLPTRESLKTTAFNVTRRARPRTAPPPPPPPPPPSATRAS